MMISRLWSYPVKSMRGHVVDEVMFGPGGLLGDRAYGFLDDDSGHLVSAKRPKRYGAMLECRASFVVPPTVDHPVPAIRVEFPDGQVVTGDLDHIAKQVSTLLGRSVQLVTSIPGGAMFEEDWPEIDGLGPDSLADALEVTPADGSIDRVVALPAGLATNGSMHDFAPLHLMPMSTLRAFGVAHPDGVWDERRFRPNLVIDDGAAALDGLAQDAWMGRDLLIGDEVRLRVVAPTPRCVMTTLAQGDLPRDLDILRTTTRLGSRELGELGKFACAGVYAEVVTAGIVRTGDPVRFADASVPGPRALADAVAMLASVMGR